MTLLAIAVALIGAGAALLVLIDWTERRPVQILLREIKELVVRRLDEAAHYLDTER